VPAGCVRGLGLWPARSLDRWWPIPPVVAVRAGGSWIQTVGLDRNPRDAVVHQVQEPVAGRPRKPEPVVLGSVIGIGTVEQRIALIDDALAKAARLLCRGKAPQHADAGHVMPKMRLYHEETCGPVKFVVRVDGVEKTIACANDNVYGLC